MPNLLAAVWLLGLFAAAPLLRTQDRYAFVDRLRDAIILGVAVPLGLGLVHALYTAALWAALAVCIALSYMRTRRNRQEDLPLERIPYLLVAALVAVAWPQLVRPLLDGDSLWYHLPNAASWVQAHSVWTTATNYWMYPPASELFAGGLYAASTPFALPWCGFVALSLLGFRIAAWSRELGASPLLADAIAAATVTVYPLAIQGGTLQNDVWLAAFWLEALWLLRGSERTAAMPAVAVTALLKPQGWIVAAIALIVRKAPLRVWLVACAALGVWALRDVLLSFHEVVYSAAMPPSGTVGEDLIGSTILAHAAIALPVLARILLGTSPFALVALCAAFLGPLIAKEDRGLGWGACLTALLFGILPFGYASNVPQLDTGASLRFAAPAIAAGALVLVVPALRISTASSVLGIASAVFGVAMVLNLFWNDGSTRSALAIAPIVALLVLLARRVPLVWLNPLIFAALVVLSTHYAGRHPIDYYADALRVNGKASGVYGWIGTTRPAAIGGSGLRLGIVNILSPSTRTIDLPDIRICAQARVNRALLVAVAESDRTAAFNAARLGTARRCGTILYDDHLAVASKP